MAKLTFYGATGTVTGSKYLVEVQNQKLLIDCGLFQGNKEDRLRNWQPFPIAPAEIGKVFLTHAHVDHTAYLPRLCQQGFSGQVVCTHATNGLCNIMLRDSAHLQEEDARWANKKGFSKHTPALPLYTTEDTEKALSYFKSVNYGEEYYLNDSKIRIKFKDAGHILGSSFIEFKIEYGTDSRKILFSGDFGRPGGRVLKDPTQVFNVDYLILESTYGDRLHDDIDPVEELGRIINESYDRRGVLVIPSFAVGRTQALLFLIRELEEQGQIPYLQIYVDSPMAINTTQVFREHLSDFNIVTRVEYLNGKLVFNPKNLHICRDREESKKLNRIKNGAIIISASGMVNGGRILHHMANRLPNSNDTVLFIGYQAEGTRGRTILEGKPTVKIHGQEIPINAKIEKINGFSAHGDYNEILAWLMGFNKKPERVFIVHGEEHASKSLAEKIQKQFGWNVVIPAFLDSFELDF